MKIPSPKSQVPNPKALLVVLVMLVAAPVHAQDIGIRAFADIGSRTFTATESFNAILGSDSGVVFGGGVEGTLPRGLFVNVRASRFRAEGERVFIVDDEQFDLGIPATITVSPLELTGGYRLPFWARIVPYAGLGVGWHTYRESSGFATDGENVETRRTGLHLLGGVEYGVARWIAAAGELQWANVPDALGEDPNGVAAHFDENNLGGVTLRVKIVVGR
jgi:opacity protein-like surface antigen